MSAVLPTTVYCKPPETQHATCSLDSSFTACVGCSFKAICRSSPASANTRLVSAVARTMSKRYLASVRPLVLAPSPLPWRLCRPVGDGAHAAQGVCRPLQGTLIARQNMLGRACQMYERAAAWWPERAGPKPSPIACRDGASRSPSLQQPVAWTHTKRCTVKRGLQDNHIQQEL